VFASLFSCQRTFFSAPGGVFIAFVAQHRDSSLRSE